MNKTRRTRILYALHKWTGLLIGLNVLLFSLTAVYMLSVDILVKDEGAQHRPVLDRSKLVPVQPLFDALAAHYSEHNFVADRITYALAEGDEHELRVELGNSHTHLRYAADPYTGALRLRSGTLPEGVAPYTDTVAIATAAAKEPDAPQPLYARLDAFFLSLHSSLALGVTGTLITGVVGVIFLISTVTGWLIYGPFMKALVFGLIRRNRASNIVLADMHKLVGMAALTFNLVMVVTGIGLTLGLFAIRFQVLSDLKKIETQVGQITPSTPYPDIDEVHAAAKVAFPDHTIIRLEYPGPDALQGDKVFTFFAEEDPFAPGLVPDVGIVTAEAVPRAQVYELTWWMHAILLGAPLHTGSFGGRLVYVAYLLLSLSSGFLSVSGYLMYVFKWRRSRALSRSREAQSNIVLNAASQAEKELVGG